MCSSDLVIAFPKTQSGLDPMTNAPTPVAQKQLDEIETFVRGDARFPQLDDYDGLTDITVAPYFEDLDRLYPESKFVLTVREEAGWLKSCKNHWTGRSAFDAGDGSDEHKTHMEIRRFLRAAVYASYDFEPERFVRTYRRHVENVKRYFADRPNDLLVLDITKGEGYEKLAPFLGVPVPTKPSFTVWSPTVASEPRSIVCVTSDWLATSESDANDAPSTATSILGTRPSEPLATTTSLSARLVTGAPPSASTVTSSAPATRASDAPTCACSPRPRRHSTSSRAPNACIRICSRDSTCCASCCRRSASDSRIYRHSSRSSCATRIASIVAASRV